MKEEEYHTVITTGPRTIRIPEDDKVYIITQENEEEITIVCKRRRIELYPHSSTDNKTE